MSTAKDVAKFNELLGRELGRNPQSEPIFQWAWSEDLFWPQFRTGRMVTKRVPAKLLDSGETEWIEMVVPEYARVKLSDKLKNQWVVTKWFPPEELPMWQHNFPMADYPANGYRIHTNASLDPFQVPTLADTEHFIHCIREQRSMSLENRIIDMQREADYIEKEKDRVIRDEVRDLMPAFANYQPGKRGGYVSLPATKRELAHGKLKASR